MSLKTLLVEDSPHKKERVLDFLLAEYPEIAIKHAGSFTSGCRLVKEDSFDLAIIDVTLPTYDRDDKYGGGKMRNYGGREIARKIMKIAPSTKIIFLTQYASFSDQVRSHTFESLKAELKVELRDQFLSMLYFDTSQSAWKSELALLLKNIR